MDKWLQEIVKIKSHSGEPECPVCGSNNVQYKETLIQKKTGLGFADIWCGQCRNAYHVSRGVFFEPMSTTRIIPDGLKY